MNNLCLLYKILTHSLLLLRMYSLMYVPGTQNIKKNTKYLCRYISVWNNYSLVVNMRNNQAGGLKQNIWK